MCKRTKTVQTNLEVRVAMINATKKYIASKKYNVVMQGKALKTKKCIGPNDNPKVGCGQATLIGAIKPDKSKVIWICMNRFNPDEKKRCYNWRRGKLPVQDGVNSGSGSKKSNPVSKTIAGVANKV